MESVSPPGRKSSFMSSSSCYLPCLPRLSFQEEPSSLTYPAHKPRTISLFKMGISIYCMIRQPIKPMSGNHRAPSTQANRYGARMLSVTIKPGRLRFGGVARKSGPLPGYPCPCCTPAVLHRTILSMRISSTHKGACIHGVNEEGGGSGYLLSPSPIVL